MMMRRKLEEVEERGNKNEQSGNGESNLPGI